MYYHTLQLHVFIVHLHAHSSRVRIQEAKSLLEVCFMYYLFGLLWKGIYMRVASYSQLISLLQHLTHFSFSDHIISHLFFL